MAKLSSIKQYLIRLWWYNFTKAGLEQQRILMIQQRCNHAHWNCDTQIRTIKCKDCGKVAWIDDYVDLYKH